MEEKVFFTNVVSNEDGTISFDTKRVSGENEIGSGREENIVKTNEDINTTLRERVINSIEVFVEGESIGNGLVA